MIAPALSPAILPPILGPLDRLPGPMANVIPGRDQLAALFVERDGVMTDIIGLSAAALWAALPATHRSIYLVDENTLRSAETIITNIEASEYLNAEGGALKGLPTKSYAQYAAGTDAAILTKADRYYRFYTGAMVFVFFGGSDADPSESNVESNTVTIPNIAFAKSYTVTGGTASKNGGSWGASGSVVAGDTLKLRGNASASFETTTTVNLAFGADESTFDITTRAANVSPNALTFTPTTNANLSTAYISNSQTIAGLEAEGAFTVTGGAAEKNGSGTFAASGTIVNTDTIKLRGTSEATYLTPKVVTFTASNTVATYTITTKAEPVGGGSEYDLTIDDEALTIDLETLTVDAV